MCKDPIEFVLLLLAFLWGTRNIISLPELQPAVNSQPVLYEKRNFALSWISFCNTSYLFWVSAFICVFAGVVVFDVLQICEWTALQPVYDEREKCCFVLAICSWCLLAYWALSRRAQLVRQSTQFMALVCILWETGNMQNKMLWPSDVLNSRR